ncbi:3-oxoacyl-ACP reductase FabG [Kangiella profundi]|uniref:3-oxoacyl-ACP reductase FabG n=1 Tax=Kangiella profundi TaxID=1561924 RepID=A0A2K9AHV9_9GAMM|nr:3-ketoacyl-ACP reductase FabG2 [Kangiella profundi]AUD79966.1 3-oxoacyl-ACP reductase FabG [Kangiella profundi]MBD3667632.1 3-oxoacyl-ACP reductase FabG [Kangiella sp.]GGE93757.1 beta-ketoacyl-ACP reductase [Kangiella profundi]
MSRRVLVTGSSRGIGKSIALQLAKSGFAVTVHCRSGIQQANQTIEEIQQAGGKAQLLQFDIADRQQTQQALESDIEQNGAYYGVVCNAGITRDNAFPALSDSDWDDVIHTNLDGFYNVVKPLVMPMVREKQGGRIVVMSSVSGVLGNRGQVNYSASKAGLIGATKALAVELARRKITVNCVAPGLIETDMVDDELASEAMKMIPARRMGKPEEIAGLVSYLFSDTAGYLTRQVISVNGGMA